MPKDTFVNTPPQHNFGMPEEKRYHRIEMIRLIGRGTFSQVYLSRDLHTGDSIAVKVMDLRRYEDEFNSEVSIMMSLSFQGIDVRYLSSETDEDNETGYIYMSYVPFPTLSEYLSSFSYGLKERQAFLIFQNLLKALDDLHSRNVAHKDVKPENIFVDPDTFNVSLLDFGLSSFVTPSHNENKFCGSPLYMSPEVLNKERNYDPFLAEVWSIGTILYEMLIGIHPWAAAENLEDLIEFVNNVEYPSFISSNARTLLSGMLEVNTSKRDDIQKIRAKLISIFENYS